MDDFDVGLLVAELRFADAAGFEPAPGLDLEVADEVLVDFFAPPEAVLFPALPLFGVSFLRLEAAAFTVELFEPARSLLPAVFEAPVADEEPDLEDELFEVPDERVVAFDLEPFSELEAFFFSDVFSEVFFVAPEALLFEGFDVAAIFKSPSAFQNSLRSHEQSRVYP